MSFLRIALLVLVGLVISPAKVMAADVCVKDHHAGRFGENTADLQDYRCGSDRRGGGLRVTFYRVSEVLAGSLLMGTPLPNVDQLLGQISFVDNEVYREAKALFTNYGTSRTYDSADTIDWSVSVGGASGTSAAPSPRQSSRNAAAPIKVWYLSRLFGPIVSDGILLKSPTQETLNSDHWPSGYQMTYDCPSDEKSFIPCTTIWRYVGIADFDPIVNDVKEAYQRAERELSRRGPNRDPDRLNDIKLGMSDFERNFALYRYLDRRKLPDKFMFISSIGNSEVCDSRNWTFRYAARPLEFDLAVIENLTGQPMRIDEFIGARADNENFRPTVDSAALNARSPVSLGQAPAPLQSGARVAVALRIAFAEEPLPDPQSDEPAETTYKKISSKPPRFLFKSLMGGFNSGKSVSKVRESFLPPSKPIISAFAYGPEVTLSGLSIGGKQFTLEGRASNVLEASFPSREVDLNLDLNKITIRPLRQGECCPVLYSWRDDAQAWVYHGKVLHLANGPEREMTDRVEFKSLRTRFRIAEEEPEGSLIQRTHLKLTLRDGQSVRLSPRTAPPGVVRADSAAEVDFDLPPGVAAGDVATSEFEIVGYYHRYSDLLSGANDTASPAARGQRAPH
jgi:hypothetical protein